MPVFEMSAISCLAMLLSHSEMLSWLLFTRNCCCSCCSCCCCCCCCWPPPSATPAEVLELDVVAVVVLLSPVVNFLSGVAAAELSVLSSGLLALPFCLQALRGDWGRGRRMRGRRIKGRRRRIIEGWRGRERDGECQSGGVVRCREGEMEGEMQGEREME